MLYRRTCIFVPQSTPKSMVFWILINMFSSWLVLQSWVQVFHTFFTNSTLVWTNSTTTTTQNKCSCFQLIGPVIQDNFCIYRLSFLRWRQSIIFNWHCIYFGSEVVEVKWWTTIYHFHFQQFCSLFHLQNVNKYGCRWILSLQTLFCSEASGSWIWLIQRLGNSYT